MKKILSILIGAAVLALPALSQAADDGFLVPLDEDLTKSVSASSDNTGGGTVSAPASGPSIAQGVWIEATSSTKAIIRDIKSGEKSGYELDNTHAASNANWWFWGDFTPNFHLDAEISVWDFDKTLYQANSFADADPKVKFKDGIQSLAALPFSWMYNANDSGIGAFNKMGFTIVTPYVNTKIGYGTLKANGMIDFDGIYYVIDRWDDQGKGFTEFSNGADFRSIGNFTIDAVAALSMMHGTYGMYDLLRVRYGDDENSPLVDGVLTFGSASEAKNLFDYSTDVKNAASAYVAFSPFEDFKAEVHVLGTFGTGITFGLDTLAFAGRAGYSAEKWSLSVMESYAGGSVNSVWGADGQSYDDINAGKNFIQLDFEIRPAEFITLGLDEGFALPSKSGNTFYLNHVSDTLSDFELRNQPYVDLDLSSFIGSDFTVGLYGVINVANAVNGEKSAIVPALDEAGIELAYEPDFGFLKKLTVDYALSMSYDKWTSSQGSYLKNSGTNHSVIVAADITDNFNVFGGMIYRAKATVSAKDQPLGFAAGYAFNRTPLPGRPKFWMHFAYGMDPFEDNNYSLFRADDAQNKPLHRTYLLNTLDANMTDSFIRVGLIWDL